MLFSKRNLVLIIALLLLYQILSLNYFLSLREQQTETIASPPKLWKSVTTTGDVESDFNNLIEMYLMPWRHITDPSRKIITSLMFDDMEKEHYGYGVRVRIVNGQVYFRHLYQWTVDYYPFRMGFHLHLLRQAHKIHGLPNVEFFLGLSDGPKSVSDTSNPMAGLPLFSARTSRAFLDIAIPDSTEYGAHGDYYVEDNTVPWEKKLNKLYFRGSTTCFSLHADNWHMCPRIKAILLGNTRPDLFDFGITKWSHVTIDKSLIINSTGIQILPKEPLSNQFNYKYIFDIEGGWGSSRKQSILKSGSVMFVYDSPWFTFYEPLLVENKHFLNIDRYFENLVSKVEYAQDHDELMKEIADTALEFSQKYLSVKAAVLYWKILLHKWAEISEVPTNVNEVQFQHCNPKNPKMGNTPLGCSKGWMLFKEKEFVTAYSTFYPSPKWDTWENHLPIL